MNKPLLVKAFNIVINYWNNKKSLKRTYSKETNAVIGATFRDIDYDSLVVDEGIVELMKNPELTFNHAKQGDVISVYDFESKRRITKVCESSYFYVGLDQRKDYESAEDILSV